MNSLRRTFGIDIHGKDSGNEDASEDNEKIKNKKIDALEAARLFEARERSLKPSLADYAPGDAINIHPFSVRAAAESFRRNRAERC